MRNETLEKFDAYVETVAKLNGVSNATKKFAVSPSVQQKLETRIQESSEFLKRVNMIGVTEQQGEKLGLGIGSPIAGTTDTTKQDRETTDVSDLDAKGYICTQTNFDSHITYAKLDAWAKFADFQAKLRDAIVKRQALDRIAIGFNGTSRAATSDRTKNPLLQDVNKGWLQKYRDEAAARVLHEGTKAAGKVQVGKGGDYENLDALVFDILASMVDPWHQDDTGLFVFCGRGLMHDKYFPIINTTQAPTETLAADVIVSQKRIGGLPAVSVPFFPPHALLITRFDNLSIYTQDGGRRRNIVDNSKRDRIENYESSNDAYVVEDFGCGAMAENIELLPKAA